MEVNNNNIESAINSVMKPTTAEANAKLAESNDESCYIKGYDLNNGLDYDKILNGYMTTGFQATNFAKAVNEINRMVCALVFFVLFEFFFNFKMKIKNQFRSLANWPICLKIRKIRP